MFSTHALKLDSKYLSDTAQPYFTGLFTNTNTHTSKIKHGMKSWPDQQELYQQVPDCTQNESFCDLMSAFNHSAMPKSKKSSVPFLLPALSFMVSSPFLDPLFLLLADSTH